MKCVYITQPGGEREVLCAVKPGVLSRREVTDADLNAAGFYRLGDPGAAGRLPENMVQILSRILDSLGAMLEIAEWTMTQDASFVSRREKAKRNLETGGALLTQLRESGL